MELFTKVVDDEGKESYEAYEPKTSDLDDDTFYADERYKTVADRDAQRRIRHRQVVDQLEEHNLIVDDEGKVTAKEVDDPEKPPPAPKPIDRDELYADFRKRMADEQQKQRDEADALDKQVDGLLEKHKLQKDTFKTLLMLSTDPEQAAEELGRANLKFDETNDGDNSDDDGMGNLVADFRKRMQLDAS